jgi:hypothetical protein
VRLAIYLCLSAIWLSAMPRVVLAQDTEIKFVVPVNLTNLMPAIKLVRVMCNIQSVALIAKEPGKTYPFPNLNMNVVGVDVQAVNGRVTASIEVVAKVPRLEDPAGKTASYNCQLMGGVSSSSHLSGIRWGWFRPDDPDIAMRLPVTSFVGNFPLVDQ